MRLAAVIFDWGGTLVPWSDLDLADLWSGAARLLAPEDPGPVVAALVAAEQAMWLRCDATLASATITDVITDAARRTGLPVDEVLHDRLVETHLEAMTPHTRCRPEAAGVLRALRELGLRTGLLSNTHWPREWHERFLARDGVVDLLDSRVYTSDLDHIKPHPAAFAAVLEQLRVAPEEAVFVGDRPVDDILGASRAGLRTIWLPNGRLTELVTPPDAIAERFEQVLDQVTGWLGDGAAGGRPAAG